MRLTEKPSNRTQAFDIVTSLEIPADKRTDSTQDWSVYLVECADGTYYCGIAVDVEARLAAHNAGRGAKYTRGRGPVRVVWREGGHNRGSALRRECVIKALTRAQKEQLASNRNS